MVKLLRRAAEWLGWTLVIIWSISSFLVIAVPTYAFVVQALEGGAGPYRPASELGLWIADMAGLLAGSLLGITGAVLTFRIGAAASRGPRSITRAGAGSAWLRRALGSSANSNG